jgi:hypothetical protein
MKAEQVDLEMGFMFSEITKQIHTVRGVRVMLDSDLAHLYQIQTRPLNQTVRRNFDRFPKDFMFQLTKHEFETLMSQNVTSKKNVRGGRRKLPLVFTDLGVGLLSAILNNNRAIQVSICAFRAFAQRRQVPENQTSNAGLEQSLQEFKQSQARLEGKFDAYLESIKKPSLRLSSEIVSPPAQVHAQSIFAGPTLTKEIEAIQGTVASYFGIKIKDLKTATRAKEIAVPRQIAIYLVRKHTEIGLKHIGKYFGDRDHTTVLHAYRKVSAEMGKNGVIRDAVVAIESELQTAGKNGN